MEELRKALDNANIKIIKFDPKKQKPITIENGASYSFEKFAAMLIGKLSRQAINFPEVWDALHDMGKLTGMVEELSIEDGVLRENGKIQIELPPGIENLTLNMDMTAKSPEDRFFLTTPDERVSMMSGSSYLLLMQINNAAEAASMARKVYPVYLPRAKSGTIPSKRKGEDVNLFNLYRPPSWRGNLKLDKNPPQLPKLFRKLIWHLFPIEEERDYFFDWLYASLFDRAFVYLVLCGNPGTGKNRLKLVMRALHGHDNTVDGKKSSLTERFNSQFAENTLAWFDELRYDMDMENTMKELQNDSISIERKGVDATKGTEIYPSLVISNNLPRDNYIAFDARKFAPLKLNEERLEASMTPEEIDELTKKVEKEDSGTFDVLFLVKIIRWLKKRGITGKWPNLEYRGPMFWELAKTSMTVWQKKTIEMLSGTEQRIDRNGWDDGKGAFLWSKLYMSAQRKNGDKSQKYPDFTTVQIFLEKYRDGKGQKAFETEAIKGSIMGDFYVKPLFDAPVTSTEPLSMSDQRKVNAKKKERTKKFDL